MVETAREHTMRTVLEAICAARVPRPLIRSGTIIAYLLEPKKHSSNLPTHGENDPSRSARAAYKPRHPSRRNRGQEYYMTHMVADSPRSTGSSLIAICLIALATHQIFRRVETYSFTIHFSLLCTPLLLSFELLRGTMPAVWAALVSSATFLSTLFLSIVFYRLSPFHPLAQYPGPMMCKLTKFWMAYLSLEGYQHLYVQRLHDRYGDVVRIGPNELSFRDASIINAVLGAGGPHRGPRKRFRSVASM
ncbi:hypothetical protein NUW54_g12963 [Trametes sanguinea]|uniref:Uncharacterized protein n=1 Tax=Trametes sanguinea TaxID=158606 RepID=A0ACC1MQZ4_9APHY|nr:hypothetical protein NUW54_g12963 [Trametes sanguinea]